VESVEGLGDIGELLFEEGGEDRFRKHFEE